MIGSSEDKAKAPAAKLPIAKTDAIKESANDLIAEPRLLDILRLAPYT
jgi:hypothetical protein